MDFDEIFCSCFLSIQLFDFYGGFLLGFIGFALIRVNFGLDRVYKVRRMFEFYLSYLSAVTKKR